LSGGATSIIDFIIVFRVIWRKSMPRQEGVRIQLEKSFPPRRGFEFNFEKGFPPRRGVGILLASTPLDLESTPTPTPTADNTNDEWKPRLGSQCPQ
jgi:hypothetical protein